jgi:putative flippase GtrA
MSILDQLRPRFPRAIGALETRLVIMRKAVSFGLVGVVNAAIDFAVFWTAVQAFDLPKIPANVLAWMVAVSASYVMNSFTTFAAESGRKLRWRSYGAFVASGVAGMVASTVALVIADWLLRALIAGADLRLAIAKVSAIGVSFLVNFSLSHFVVFRPRHGTAGEGR